MKRLSWGFIMVLGCTVADEPAPVTTEGRALSDFDPAAYEILSLEELEARELIVESDGERVELASIVDAEWIVLPREPELPIAQDDESAADVGADGLELSSDADPQAGPCPWHYFRQYEVPVNTYVWTCYPPSGGGIPLCVGTPTVVVHHIACSNSCGACNTFTCYDSTSHTNVSQPAAGYLVSSTSIAC
jgi:hypothetical protein